jgi:hypothetical protein
MLADLRGYAHFATGLPGFLRRPISAAEARRTVERRMAERGESFLRLAREGIYCNPGSPYLRLLTLAGCTLGDLEAAVQRSGLEGALEKLLDAGVFVTFEEFKGRQPLIRHGHHVPTPAGAFDNPRLARHLIGGSGGSTGSPSRVAIDLDHIRATAPAMMLAEEANGVRHVPWCLWRSTLPSIAGFRGLLRGAVMGHVAERWFVPGSGEGGRGSFKDRLATSYALRAAALAGVHLPRPEPVPLEHAETVARWAAGEVRRRGACMVRGHVSALLRVALEAQRLSLDLSGAAFWGGGEPPTPAKVREIVRCGARYVPSYQLSEVGAVGLACSRPSEPSDVHLIADHVAIVQRPRVVPGTMTSVNAFCLTTLLAASPKLLLNVESDDYGVLETRRCGCPLESCGYRTHISRVHSFGKLTGEGMTLVGSDMVRILEEVLPQRFGGTALDYQLREEEDDEGLTRLILVVHPRVALCDEGEVIATVLEALGKGEAAAELARAIWRHAGTFRVRREPPQWTAAGKFLPLVTALASAGEPARNGGR